MEKLRILCHSGNFCVCSVLLSGSPLRMDDWEENEDLLAEGVAIGERMGYAEGVVLG